MKIYGMTLFGAATILAFVLFANGARPVAAGHGTTTLCGVGDRWCYADQWMFPEADRSFQAVMAVYDGQFGSPCIVSDESDSISILAYTSTGDWIDIGTMRGDSGEWGVYANCSQCTGDPPSRELHEGDMFTLSYLPPQSVGGSGIWYAWLKPVGGNWDLLLERTGMGMYASRVAVIAGSSSWENDIGVSNVTQVAALQNDPITGNWVKWRQWNPHTGYGGKLSYYYVASQGTGRYQSMARPALVNFFSDHHILPHPQTDACGNPIR